MKKYSPKLWELFSIERRKKKEKEKLKTILLNTVFMQNPYKKKVLPLKKLGDAKPEMNTIILKLYQTCRRKCCYVSGIIVDLPNCSCGKHEYTYFSILFEM